MNPISLKKIVKTVSDADLLMRHEELYKLGADKTTETEYKMIENEILLRRLDYKVFEQMRHYGYGLEAAATTALTK